VDWKHKEPYKSIQIPEIKRAKNKK